jgi:hypothetical protein
MKARHNKKIVLLTFPADQGDMLRDFLEWHLDLGVDLILALDFGSTDGSRELLDQYSRTGQVKWFPLPERDMTKYSGDDALAALARDRYHADWIINCDVDEFLCTEGADLRTILADAERDDVTLLGVPRLSMTGAPLQLEQRATQALTLRIDRPVTLTYEQQISGDLPVPFIFVDVGGHLIIRASAFDEYGPGAHTATVTWGAVRTSDRLHILTYPIRAFETLQKKTHNTAAWLDDNMHLPPIWGWHWRRWIALNEKGRLREEYDAQFVSPERAQELVREGICVVDDTIAEWIARKQWNSGRGVSNLIQRIGRATISPFRHLVTR